ncbi:MAG: hypothetical protein ACXABY_11455 [Candidatus Thorarchaeota archaeon]|jgi:hypothetical protein
MSNFSEDYVKGRQKGLDEALTVLLDMERRYRQWAHHNPGIEGIPDSARGKIEAVTTAHRAITNRKNLPAK